MPDNMSGLIWIQSVWNSDGIPEIIFQKSWFWKNQQKTKNMKKKHMKITQEAKH